MIDGGRLKSFIDRIERLEGERTGVGRDIRDVYSEAKGTGFDVKTMRKIVQLRKLDSAERDEQDEMLDRYMHALGMYTGGRVQTVRVEVPADTDAIDERAVKAIELLRAGKSIRAVSADTGMKHASVQRLRKALMTGAVSPSPDTPTDTPAADTPSVTEPAATDPTPAVFCAGDSNPRTVAVAAVPEMQGGLAPTQSPSGESVPERVPAPAGDISPSTKRATVEVAPAAVKCAAPLSSRPVSGAIIRNSDGSAFDPDRNMPSFLRR